MRHFLLALLILSTAIVSFGLEVNVIKEWKYIDFEWESPEQKQQAINSGRYNQSKCLLYDVNKAADGRLFGTLPSGLGPGSPATLATVTNETGPGGPLLRPYPDWNWYNRSCRCEGILNVYRVHIQCNYIFVLDNGKIGPNQTCNPKLLIFDLKDDILVQTIYIPLNIATNQTGSGLLIAPYVYVASGKCDRFLDKMIVFMADTEGSGLVIYDSSRKLMCRVESDCMKPTNPHFSVAGQNFTHEGGIYSVTVSGDDLYYAAISGEKVCKIKIRTLLKCPNKERANEQSKFAFKLSSQTGPMTSVKNVIFYSDISKMSLLGKNVYWNWRKPVVLAQDSEKLQIIHGLKYSPFWDQLLYFTDRYQLSAVNKMNPNKNNFRYLEMNLSAIRAETNLFE